MADSIIQVDQIESVDASSFLNTDSIFVLINGALRRMSKNQFITLLNNSVKGEKGDQGLTGIRGEKGTKGDTGATGATGLQGAQGVQGEKGDTVLGWSPLIISVVSGGLVYLYLTDWVGGTSAVNKPTQRGYLSPTGIVSNISDGAISVSSDFTSSINDLYDQVALKMPLSASTSDVVEGGRLYFTTSRVLATLLSGFSPTTGSVTSADTVLVAFNKLQGQVNTKQDASSLQADVRATPLTGFSVGSNSSILSSDTVLQAFSKVQAQVNAKQDASSLQADVRATPLTGLSTATSTAITASDSVLTASGKLQAQITDRQTIANLPSDVRSVNLTGLSTATSTAITASDSILVALGKLQAQITSLTARVVALETAP